MIPLLLMIFHLFSWLCILQSFLFIVIYSIINSYIYASYLLIFILIINYTSIYFNFIYGSNNFIELHNRNKGGYFKEMNLIKNEDKNEDKTMYCFHPHGIFSLGFVINGRFNNHFKNTTFLISSMMFLIPFMELYLDF